MGIGVRGEGCGEVTQRSADRIDVHSVLEGDGRLMFSTPVVTLCFSPFF